MKLWKYTNRNDFILSLHLIDLEDQKRHIQKLYAISNHIESNYRRYVIKKKNGKERVVYEPSATLKHIQRQILTYILNNKHISPYATAYYLGACLKNNALPHVCKKIILKLDIEDFFGHVRFMDVYESCFPMAYFPMEVGMLLTHLCTYQGHLPQGAPTSSYISNLVMNEFDQEVGSWCSERSISYTRYSDDMTFSGDFLPCDVIAFVRAELRKLGLRLNYEKTRVVSQGARQVVTGIVVNDKAQVSVTYRKKIRQEIYYIKKYGVRSHLERIGLNIDGELYIRQLYGRILYVLQVNPEDAEFRGYREYLNGIKK